jgi:hypothetical protein
MLLIAAFRPRCITIITDFLSSTLRAVVANAPTFKIVPDDFVCHPAIDMTLKAKTPGLYRGFLNFGHLFPDIPGRHLHCA